MAAATRVKILALVALLLLVAAAYWLLRDAGLMRTLMNRAALHEAVVQMGAWGPPAVISLMVLAILVSPIPSAPIAVAAGAAYGQIWGTIYVLTGAELGAMIAFGLARWLGADALKRWFGDRLSGGLMGSQNALTGIVLVSRLLPFVSFDVISYAAGLTVLSFWRFAAATLIGIVPASFLLAHFGGELGSGDASQMAWAVLALGAITLIPLLAKGVRDYRRSRRSEKP